MAVVDNAVMERNLASMTALAAAAGLALRPHAKTHKSAAIGRRQVALGAVGLTVATLQEAEMFAAAGIQDLLVVHPPVGPKRSALASLAERVRRLAVALDTVELARGLDERIEVMWEVDSGGHRLGTPPGEPTAERVAELVGLVGSARFRGLLTHGGHAYAGDREAAARDEAEALATSAAAIRERGIEVRELSVGSTPTAAFAATAAAVGVTEMRPGTYVFGDANQVRLGACALADCALGVVATVVSVPEPGRLVLDAGSKAISSDLRAGVGSGHGIVLGHPRLVIDRLSEEHAVVLGDSGLRVEDRVLVIPNHVCTTVNLHRRLVGIDGGEFSVHAQR